MMGQISSDTYYQLLRLLQRDGIQTIVVLGWGGDDLDRLEIKDELTKIFTEQP
jgi:hypothetical protein